MRSTIFYHLLLFIFVVVNSIGINAQTYSNRYFEVKRLENKKQIPFNDTMEIIYMNDQDIIWQRKGGLGYKGAKVDNYTIDFKFKQFTIGKNSSQDIIELIDGPISHILERQKAYDNTQYDHVKISIPELDIDKKIDPSQLMKHKWKLTRVLNKNGQIFQGTVPQKFHTVRAEKGYLSFFNIDDEVIPEYQLMAHEGSTIYLQNNESILVPFYIYLIDDGTWFLSDIKREVFYNFELFRER